MKDIRFVAEGFDKDPSPHHLFEVEFVKKSVHGKNILDVGCWTGQWLGLIEDVSRTFGIDPNKQAVDYANKVRKGQYKKGDALSIPYESNKFDIVTMWDVIEHLPSNSEIQALEEVSRVLKPKGLFYLSTVTSFFWSTVLDPAWWLLGHRHYSERRLRALLAMNFIVEEVVYSGSRWTWSRDMINLFGKHILKWKSPSNIFISRVKNEHKGEGYLQIHIKARRRF